jgi:hypothetical protein
LLAFNANFITIFGALIITGKPSIVVRLDIKNFAHLFKDRIKKSPYRDKVGIDSKCKEESQKSPYPSVDNRLSLNNLEESCQSTHLQHKTYLKNPFIRYMKQIISNKNTLPKHLLFLSSFC